jgi:hypothetical protein
MTMGSLWRRLRQRQQQGLALGRPDLTTHLSVPDEPLPPPPPLVDWPAIQSRHPAWWQVARVEVHGGLERRYVLIAEVRTEAEAFRVAYLQASQVRITKWGSKERPYESMRDPKRVP